VLIRITRKAAEHKNRPWFAQQHAAVKRAEANNERQSYLC